MGFHKREMADKVASSAAVALGLPNIKVSILCGGIRWARSWPARERRNVGRHALRIKEGGGQGALSLNP